MLLCHEGQQTLVGCQGSKLMLELGRNFSNTFLRGWPLENRFGEALGGAAAVSRLAGALCNLARHPAGVAHGYHGARWQ